jgi:hypothetical protein
MLGKDHTEVLRNWNDLKQYGIISLTGEACGLSIRLLCDVTPKGRKYLEEFFGGHIKIETGSEWNHSEGQDASIMLPYGMFCEFASFLLIKAGFEVAVVTSEGSVQGMSHEMLKEYEGLSASLFKPRRIVKSTGTATGGTRNVHVMSGRVE